MSEQELREKIVEVLTEAMKPIEYGGDSEHAPEFHYPTEEELANALIAAGIGDVSEYKHRAEVAEKQVYCLAKSFAEALFKNGNLKNLIQGFIKDAQKQAEKELKEERKDEQFYL